MTDYEMHIDKASGPDKTGHYTPISDRTTESLVRAIAEWMELNAGDWVTLGEGWLLCKGHETPSYHGCFQPHASNGSEDRELVMRVMGTCKFNYPGGEDVIVTITDVEAFGEQPKTYMGYSPTLGRAFCEAVVAWIEAQQGR